MADRGCVFPGDMSGEALSIYVKSVPNTSNEAIENVSWTDKYFLETHAPQQRFSLPSIQAMKTSSFNIMRFLSGASSGYEGFFSDAKIVLLSMPSPEDINEYLFKEFLNENEPGASGSTLENPSIISKFVARVDGYYNRSEEIARTRTEPGLAEDVEANLDRDPLKADAPAMNADSIKAGWEVLFTNITSVSDQGKVGDQCKYGVALLGLQILHCFKLINRSASSAHRSMASRLWNHFKAIYNPPASWNLIVPPPHIAALEHLHSYYNTQTSNVTDLLSIILGKLMFINATPLSSTKMKGLFFGSCLTHISLYGMAPIKQLEQTALAMDMPLGSFCSMICTTLVKTQLINCVAILKSMTERNVDMIYLGKKIVIQQQTTWRYCRIYNPAHFNRFKTSLNSALLIRCAAYLKVTGRGDDIERMQILQSEAAKMIFNREVSKARHYIDRVKTLSDQSETVEAAAIYGQTHEYTGGAPRR